MSWTYYNNTSTNVSLVVRFIEENRFLIMFEFEQFVLPDGGNSRSFQAWRNWTHFKPVYRYFYFFNVLNPNQSITTGKNTTVNQIGPYVYRYCSFDPLQKVL